MSHRRPHERARVSQRDQHESAFAAILGALLARLPGARAAALVDGEGETVDYAGDLEPFQIRLTAAHWCIVVEDTRAHPLFAGIQWLAVRAGRVTYFVHVLPEGHALVVHLDRGAVLTGLRRAVLACAHAVAAEAGWSPPDHPWFPVDVVVDARRRPAALRVDGAPQPLEVLGALAGGLERGERGWRVRFRSGVEATLVREPGDVWYADEPTEPVKTKAEERRSTRPQQSR
jgi:hypothetical protein